MVTSTPEQAVSEAIDWIVDAVEFPPEDAAGLALASTLESWKASGEAWDYERFGAVLAHLVDIWRRAGERLEHICGPLCPEHGDSRDTNV